MARWIRAQANGESISRRVPAVMLILPFAAAVLLVTGSWSLPHQRGACETRSACIAGHGALIGMLPCSVRIVARDLTDTPTSGIAPWLAPSLPAPSVASRPWGIAASKSRANSLARRGYDAAAPPHFLKA
jgi:hypothetical protein